MQGDGGVAQAAFMMLLGHKPNRIMHKQLLNF
jgi:hypothetical protein